MLKKKKLERNKGRSPQTNLKYMYAPYASQHPVYSVIAVFTRHAVGVSQTQDKCKVLCVSTETGFTGI